MPLEKIVINGIEYTVTKESGATVLERFQPETGFTVRSIFLSRPDSEERMQCFMKEVAKLILMRMERSEVDEHSHKASAPLSRRKTGDRPKPNRKK